MAKRSNAVINLIAALKLIKAALLILLGVVALFGIGHDLHDLPLLSPGGKHVHHAIEKLSGMTGKQLAGLGIGMFAYAAVFLVEGIGLAFRKRWAEYLTVIVTTSFIPLEIYELVRDVSALRVLAIVVNSAVVVYLIVRLRQD
jgi:uncharacterized membrane protein (DUF2068 family)